MVCLAEGSLGKTQLTNVKVLDEIYTVHQHDPRYDPQTLERIRMFLFDPEILANPELYKELIFEMRIFALLTTTSSAYPEVRAVANNTDDPTLPTLTIRVWIIGTFFSAIGCVINSIFSLVRLATYFATTYILTVN